MYYFTLLQVSLHLSQINLIYRSNAINQTTPYIKIANIDFEVHCMQISNIDNELKNPQTSINHSLINQYTY